MHLGRLPAPARTTGAGSPALLLIAHGSRDPRHAATVDELVRLIGSTRPGLRVGAAYLEHSAPRLAQVADRFRTAVAVPLLLNRAFHARTDIPAALTEAGLDLPLADVLGPSPLLLAALDRRLAEAGFDPAEAHRTGLVLAAAGSSDRAANAATRAVAAEYRRTRGFAAVEVAHASAAPPQPADAVAALRARGLRQLAVAPYLLAPGLLPDRITTAARGAGIELIAPVLGAAPEIADLLLQRYDRARASAAVAA
ncbi:sirohydrochlorin chelatase [Kitasatospora sp. NPDC101801]|uniref:sirohydrochlorin chelatase n=1 Tax=Kitasatospora sp. NPDC101801 TaxID=3364103 RepID=UPI0037F5DDEF